MSRHKATGQFWPMRQNTKLLAIIVKQKNSGEWALQYLYMRGKDQIVEEEAGKSYLLDKSRANLCIEAFVTSSICSLNIQLLPYTPCAYSDQDSFRCHDITGSHLYTNCILEVYAIDVETILQK